MSKITTIPLAKGFKPEKLNFPVFVSEKLDGVPIRLSTSSSSVVGTTRQGNEEQSIIAYLDQFHKEVNSKNVYEGSYFVGEVTSSLVQGFKNISGTIRRHEPAKDLIWNFFDYYTWDDKEVVTFEERLEVLQEIFYKVASTTFRIIPQKKIWTSTDLLHYFNDNEIRDDQEGWVIRSHNDLWEPGKRRWGYQKIVVTPSEDIPLVKVDEAISKDGVPLGMAGKLWVEYKGQVIGCGPGALTHPERTALLKHYNSKKWRSCMIEVAYKKDPTYTALREARFVAFRPDKD